MISLFVFIFVFFFFKQKTAYEMRISDWSSDVCSSDLRATAAVPVPPTNNFVARQQLAEYMSRMDDPSKVWFVYLLGDNGNIIGYHIGSYPQSVCTFMTPPERAEWRAHNNYASAVTTAPALDGIYYKGGGCDTSFMFDDASNAMIRSDEQTSEL